MKPNNYIRRPITYILKVLLILEAKLGNSFSMAQFATSGFCKSYRLDLYLNGSGRQPWVREDILSCLCNEYKPDKVWNVYLYKLVSERRNSFFTTHAILKKITYLFKRHSSFEQSFWCLSKILWWLVLLGGLTSEKCLNNFSDANGIENF